MGSIQSKRTISVRYILSYNQEASCYSLTGATQYQKERGTTTDSNDDIYASLSERDRCVRTEYQIGRGY